MVSPGCAALVLSGRFSAWSGGFLVWCFFHRLCFLCGQRFVGLWVLWFMDGVVLWGFFHLVRFLSGALWRWFLISLLCCWNFFALLWGSFGFFSLLRSGGFAGVAVCFVSPRSLVGLCSVGNLASCWGLVSSLFLSSGRFGCGCSVAAGFSSCDGYFALQCIRYSLCVRLFSVSLFSFFLLGLVIKCLLSGSCPVCAHCCLFFVCVSLFPLQLCTLCARERLYHRCYYFCWALFFGPLYFWFDFCGFGFWAFC